MFCYFITRYEEKFDKKKRRNVFFFLLFLYIINKAKEIKINATPRTAVKRVINSSIPRSFTTPNNRSFPPVIICPASLALLPCNKTNTISNTETINKIVSNISAILIASNSLLIYHKTEKIARTFGMFRKDGELLDARKG